MHFCRYSGLLYVMMTTAAMDPCGFGALLIQAGSSLLIRILLLCWSLFAPADPRLLLLAAIWQFCIYLEIYLHFDDLMCADLPTAEPVTVVHCVGFALAGFLQADCAAAAAAPLLSGVCPDDSSRFCYLKATKTSMTA